MSRLICRHHLYLQPFLSDHIVENCFRLLLDMLLIASSLLLDLKQNRYMSGHYVFIRCLQIFVRLDFIGYMYTVLLIFSDHFIHVVQIIQNKTI